MDSKEYKIWKAIEEMNKEIEKIKEIIEGLEYRIDFLERCQPPDPVVGD